MYYANLSVSLVDIFILSLLLLISVIKFLNYTIDRDTQSLDQAIFLTYSGLFGSLVLWSLTCSQPAAEKASLSSNPFLRRLILPFEELSAQTNTRCNGACVSKSSVSLFTSSISFLLFFSFSYWTTNCWFSSFNSIRAFRLS